MFGCTATIVTAINAQGGKAVGISGKDANLMRAKKGVKPVAVEKFNIKDVDMTPQLLKNFYKPASAQNIRLKTYR